MTAIVHETPTLLDIRAVTTMGISAKPNSDNPIGQFGTGLKYAIAVLVRAGAKPVITIGRDRYIFSTKQIAFRGEEFSMVKMRLEKFSLARPSYHDLPFTTQYGRFWKMWMAFRELESNTRDEGGSTYQVGDVAEIAPDPDVTRIIIDNPEYVAAWEARDEVFLPEGKAQAEASERVQVLEGESDRLYYRGLRAMDLKRKTLRTYNFLGQIELTEDRTLKYEFQARSLLAAHIVQSDDEDFIEEVITSKECWERGLDWPRWVEPSAAFKAVVQRRPSGLWGSAVGYVGYHTPRPPTAKRTLWQVYPRPWWVSDDADAAEVTDSNGTVVMSKPGDFDGEWPALARKVVEIVNASKAQEPQIASEEVDQASDDEIIVPTPAPATGDDLEMPF